MVKIDEKRLGLRLWLSQGRLPGEWDIRSWLEQAGFQWSVGTWFVANKGADPLRPDEILEHQVLETTDGITFINRDQRQPPATGEAPARSSAENP